MNPVIQRQRIEARTSGSLRLGAWPTLSASILVLAPPLLWCPAPRASCEGEYEAADPEEFLILCDPIAKRNLSPPDIDLHRPRFAEKIISITAPCP